jgi:toxin ParE1/3/4
MTVHYTIRQYAANDLERIWDYTLQEWGIDQADSYLRSILARFSWLSENPELGKQRNDIKPGYYCFPEGKHLIFYTISKNGIDIIGVPHQNMDVTGYFDNHAKSCDC